MKEIFPYNNITYFGNNIELSELVEFENSGE